MAPATEEGWSGKGHVALIWQVPLYDPSLSAVFYPPESWAYWRTTAVVAMTPVPRQKAAQRTPTWAMAMYFIG